MPASWISEELLLMGEEGDDIITSDGGTGNPNGSAGKVDLTMQ